MTETRKLTTILALDMVGYSHAAELDDSAAAGAVRKLRELIVRLAEPRGGRIFNSAGDGFMLEFQTASAGLEAALALLEAFTALDPPIRVRIGLHAGEVIVESSGDLLGHAVNIAARLQQRAKPGEIILSEDVKRSARGALTSHLLSMGEVKLGKMSETMNIYAAGAKPRGLRLPRFSHRSRMIAAGAAMLALIVVVAAFAFQSLLNGASEGHNGRVEVALFSPLHADDADLIQRSARLSAAIVRLLAAAQVPTIQVSNSPSQGAEAAELSIGGAFDRTENAVSFAAQVIDRATGTVLWSASVERTIDDVDGIEEEAGYAVVGVLRCALDDRRTARRAISNEVFSLLLNICDAGIHGRMDTLTLTRRLLAVAPELSVAQANHALSLAHAAGEARPDSEQGRAMRAEARQLAERALARDPRLPKAYGALSALAEDSAASEHLLLRALEYNPDHAAVLNAYMGHLRQTGRLDAARDIGDRLALIPDPRALGALRPIANYRAMAGDLRGAEEAIRQFEAVHPGHGADLRWTIAVWWDTPARALAHLHELAQLAGRQTYAEPCFRAYLSRLEQARATHVRGLPTACEAYQVDWRIRLLARQGDVDGAYALAEQDPDRLVELAGIFFYPEMRDVRRDVRFIPLMRRAGLLEYWTSTNQWPDFCAEADLPYDCRAEANRVGAAVVNQ